MKYKIIFILLFAVTLPAQAVQKCTDSEGRITYADFCPPSVPAKVENLYIPDTYDPENDRLTRENVRGMEESTRQSEYDRAQRNAKISRENTLPNTDTPSSDVSKYRGSGSSRTPRTLRSGASFDEQFSAALKSKLELQKSNPSYGTAASGRNVQVIDSEGNPSYGTADSDGNVQVIDSEGNPSYGRVDSDGNVQVHDSEGNPSYGSSY